MELKDVFKEDGEIVNEKLFYFHFREFPNNIHFTDVDGCAMAKALSQKFNQFIKEEKEQTFYYNTERKYILTDYRLLFYTGELIVANSYYLTYYYIKPILFSINDLKLMYETYAHNSEYE